MIKGALKKASDKALHQALTQRKTQQAQSLLSFDNMVNKLKERIKEFPHCRICNNISKRLEDAALGAFLFHTVLEIVDEKYELIRRELVNRKTFFHHLQVLTCYFCFANWDEMMRFMVNGLELEGIDSG